MSIRNFGGPKLAWTWAIFVVSILEIQGQVFRKDPFIELYPKSSLDTVKCISRTIHGNNGKMVIDASLSVLRDWLYEPSNHLVFWTSPWGMDWYAGGKIENKNFFDNINYEAESYDMTAKAQMWQGVTSRAQKIAHLNKNYSGSTCTTPCDATVDAVGFISNIYKIEDYSYPAKLLGFVHIERSNVDMEDSANGTPDRRYAIGLAYSDNNGASWKYAGDAIRPKYDSLGDHRPGSAEKVYSNIAGIPYIKVKDGGIEYFYVYYNENVDIASRWYPAVARVKVEDALNQAVSGSIILSQWKKLGASGSWDQDGFTGTGKPLVPWTQGDLNMTHYDMHSDAAYCAPLKKYFLTANKVEWEGLVPTAKLWRRLILLASSDGITWKERAVVDEDFGTDAFQHVASYQPFYSSFYSPDAVASNDFSVIGRNFTVIYSRQHRILSGGNYDFSLGGDLYSRKLTAVPAVVPAMNLLLQ